MPSPREQDAHRARHAEGEPRRHRYSLLVEVIEGDDFTVLEQGRQGAERPRRSSRGPEIVPNANRQARRASLQARAPDVGSRERNDHPQEEARVARARSRASRPGEHNDEAYHTAPEERRRSIHSSTQTSIRGYGPHSTFTTPINLFQPRRMEGNDLDVMEIAHREGFLLGQRIANMWNPNILHAASSSPASSLSARGYHRNIHDAERIPYQGLGLRRGWRCILPRWLFRCARPPTPSPPPSTVSRNGSRRHRH
ncbi:hypothetical protein F5Y11DRAFT_312920 [Daldinia sp. FL1419]|nr:hypothetical protein F5Y11DRAFT_312920 [Daldinia sp. FL1419]